MCGDRYTKGAASPVSAMLLPESIAGQRFSCSRPLTLIAMIPELRKGSVEAPKDATD